MANFIRKFIKNNYYKMSYKKLAESLGISIGALEGNVAKMLEEGVIKIKTKAWTPKEVEFILENEDEMSNKEMAEKLGCTTDQVRKKLYYLNKYNKKRAQVEIKAIEAQNKKIEESYQRLINEPASKGLGDLKFDYQFKKDKKYKVIKLGLREGQTRINETFVGRLEQITEHFFTLKNKIGVCESFLKKDYLLDEYEIREV